MMKTLGAVRCWRAPSLVAPVHRRRAGRDADAARQGGRLRRGRAADAGEEPAQRRRWRARSSTPASSSRASSSGGPGNYAIFVLAPNGDIVDAHVMDGVVPIGVETGLMKAKTALYARTPSSAVAERFPTSRAG